MSGVLNSTMVLEREKGTGNRVVFPTPRELQIDIDSADDYVVFGEQLALLQEHFECKVFEDVPSKSEYHRHITLDFYRELAPVERLLLQACLGSDRKRELLGFINFQQGDPRPTLFILPPLVQTVEHPEEDVPY